MLREIGKKQYSKEVYSDADMLLNFNVLGAVDLNKSLTYLWGRNSNQFPLLSLTEGQGNISRKKPIMLVILSISGRLWGNLLSLPRLCV